MLIGISSSADAKVTGQSIFGEEVNQLLLLTLHHPADAIEQAQDKLKSAQTDQQKSQLHFVLARAYSELLLPFKAREEAQKAQSLINDSTGNEFKSYISLSIAEASAISGLADDIEASVKSELAKARKQNNLNIQAYALRVAGLVQLTLNSPDKALSRFQEGYALTQKYPIRLKPADFAYWIAMVYENQGEPQLAIPYFTEAQKYYQQQSLSIGKVRTEIGLGKALIATGQTNEGLLVLRDAAELALEVQDLQGVANSYRHIAEQLILRNEAEQAEPFLQDALIIFNDGRNPFMQISVLLALAEVHLQKDAYATSKDYLKRALALAEGDSFLAQRIDINRKMAQVLADQADFSAAYDLMVNNATAQGKLFKERNSKRLLRLKTEFEVEQQQIQNALLTEQNLRQRAEIRTRQETQKYGFMLIFLLIVITLLMLWLYIKGKRHRQHLEALANEDVLTTLLTRRKALDLVDQQLKLAQRHGETISLALLDLDHFKRVNDKFGHQTGDNVLRSFGILAANTFRSTDILGRYGGEEFLFAFPHTSVEQVEEMLQKFAETVKTIPENIHCPEMQTSVSIGLIEARDKLSTSELIALADQALYQAKEAGRDRIVRYQSLSEEPRS
ncbi:tetratricopeptide repeat-containing diguanylate cyclase [Alteromonas ponticola]|uniref:diguanylate cyclase n=1 Tax=Alteromonas ponticola TaxID=2720613 RepID=A0ABX1R7Q5_9ALTE|nr:GGDEF domain-containing protein [Alteromonas ponticola]NMH61536.1 diguanylate cyclase [Alteromonas ponticola]